MNFKTKLQIGNFPHECLIVEMINAFEVLSCVHHEFKGEVVLSVEGDSDLGISIQIKDVGVDWSMGLSRVYESHDIDEEIPMEEAKTRIRELTSPKVDQPAPAPKAAEIQWEEDSYPPEPEVNLPCQQEWQSECGFYIVQLKGYDYHAVYEEGDYHREADLGYHPTPEAAKEACQDHKQKRLEDLL